MKPGVTPAPGCGGHLILSSPVRARNRTESTTKTGNSRRTHFAPDFLRALRAFVVKTGTLDRKLLNPLTLSFGMLSAVLSLSAQPLPFDATRMDEAVQDGSGRVWALGHETGLFRWEQGQWQAQDVRLPEPATNGVIATPLTPGARPVLLQTNQQGVAYALWSRGGDFFAVEDQYWLTQLPFTNPPVSVAFRAEIAHAFVTFASDGVGWLTEPGPRVYRIGPNLEVELAYTISSNQMSGTRFDLYNPVQSFALEERGVLLWGERRFQELATLREPLLISGTNIAAFPPISGLPDGGFSILAPVDSGRWWAGIPSWDKRTGLYEVELETRRAVRLPEPAPEAFAHVLGITTVRADRYVVSMTHSWEKSLWRWRAGVWDRMSTPLDSASFDDYYRISRPFVPSDDGLWVGTGGNGLLFLPSSPGAKAESFDWRHGQPLESVHRILPLAEGGMLLVGFAQGTTSARPGDLRRGRSVSPRLVDLWKNAANLQFDAQGNLWTLLGLPAGEKVLARWNGAEWKYHPLPDHVRKGDLGSALGIDTLGRLWVRYRERLWITGRNELQLTDKVDLFTPATSGWQRFDSLETAFSELRQTNALARVDLPGPELPDFGPRGQICFSGMDWAKRERIIHFFDGQTWRQWDLAEIGFVRPGYLGLGLPFFTAEGALAINSSGTRKGKTTMLFDGQRWSDAPFRSAGVRDPNDPYSSRPSMAWLANDAVTPTRGGGGSWKASKQQLVQSNGRISIPQFDLADVHPFIGARRVEQVWVDARGNIILSTRLPAGNLSGNRHYVVLAPRAPFSRPQMDWVKVNPGNVEPHFRPDAEASVTRATSAVNETAGSVGAGEGFTAVEVEGDHITLRWNGAGVLEVADQVQGPWREIRGAFSPHTAEMTQPAEFYRIRR